jgi:hypothetical protein
MAYGFQVCGPAKILDATAVVLEQVEGQALEFGSERLVKSTAGEPRVSFGALMFQRPKFALSTSAIAVFLAKCGVNGLVLASGFEVYNQSVDLTTGLRKGATSHEKLAIATGLMVPRQLSVAHNGEAKLTFDVIGVNAAGTVSPVVRTASQSLPALTYTREVFTLGPVKLNGTAVDGVQEVTIDFGIKEEVKAGSGALYPQLVAISEIRPRVTVRVNDESALATLGLQGVAQGATDSLIYLRKLSADGQRVADGTAQHVSFSINKGLWLPSSKGGQHPGEIATSFDIEPVYDGTTETLVVATATAIA